MDEKFVPYFRFVEACGQPGCPLCLCVVEVGRRSLETLVYEQVSDPETRRRLRASWGFCNWHTWMLEEVSGWRFGAAIIYEDLLSLLVRRVGTLRDRPTPTSARIRSWFGWLAGRPSRPAIAELYRRRHRCRVCEEMGDGEERYLDTLLTFMGDFQFQRAYERSEGLCVPHLALAIERGSSPSAVGELLGLTLRKWSALRQTLESFVGKHGYRNTEPFTDEEAASCRRAFAALAGAPGVFANDLHLDHPTPARRPGVALERSQALEAPGDPRDFERRKLELRIDDLTRQLNEATSRAAALHYRLSRVAEDRNVLELNLGGERGAAQLAERALADLRAENERLRAELAALKARPSP